MFAIPEWMWEFHGHRCPFMPIGYRMGKVAMEKLGIADLKDFAKGRNLDVIWLETALLRLAKDFLRRGKEVDISL